MSPEAQSTPDPEQSSEQAYQGWLGEAELMQYPGEAGDVQLAESYSQPGTKIQWENGPFTASSDTRRALITTSDHRMYYLRGDTLYGVSDAAETGQLNGVQLDENNTMPDFTIGAPTAFFGRPVEVSHVLVATEQADANDPEATENARAEYQNPFDAMDSTFDGLRAKAAAEKQAQRQAAANQRDQEERQRKADELQETQAKTAAIELARRQLALAQDQANLEDRNKRTPPLRPFGASDLSVEEVGIFPTQHTWRRNTNRGGETTNLVQGSAAEQFDARTGPVSELGIEISPRLRITPFETNFDKLADQQKDASVIREKAYNKAIRKGKTAEEAKATAERKVQKYRAQAEADRIKPFDEKRTKPYEVLTGAEARKSLYEAAAEEPKHTYLELLRLGHGHEETGHDDKGKGKKH